MILVLLVLKISLVNMLPLLAVYGFAIMRIIPNLQQVFQGGAQIRYYGHTVDAPYRDMTTLPLPPDIPDRKAMATPVEALPFTGGIALCQLEFSYPLSGESVLKEIDLSIAKDTTIGLVGTTSCGKTTLLSATPAGKTWNIRVGSGIRRISFLP
jgi:ABC-type multidrug transport system fused ATPase/permease subunit